MKGKWAKAWAPSTIVSIPRSRAIRQIRFTGKTWPVRFVMWHTRMTFVRGVTASSNRSARTSRLGGGKGKEIVFSTMPSRRSRWRQVVSMRG